MKLRYGLNNGFYPDARRLATLADMDDVKAKKKALIGALKARLIGIKKVENSHKSRA
jgi:hypothetical protein